MSSDEDCVGLRRRVRKASVSDVDVNVSFSIEVRCRPVQGVGGLVATHAFLVLLDAAGQVVDSLSFDPSNSVGWQDADPTNVSRGSAVVTAACDAAQWKELADAFKARAGRCPYALGTHNCCNAVIEALGGCASLPTAGARGGIHLARVANNAWATGNQVPDTDLLVKKMQ
jgi:hypothetical protein